MMPKDWTAPPGALDAQMSTLTDLAALCGDVQTSEGCLGPASGASSRLAEEADWPKLRELWAGHHHLLEKWSTKLVLLFSWVPRPGQLC